MMSEPDAEEFVFENSKVRRQPIRRRPTGKHVFWKPFISTAIWFMIIMVPILRICLSYATSSFTGKLRPFRPPSNRARMCPKIPDNVEFKVFSSRSVVLLP